MLLLSPGPLLNPRPSFSGSGEQEAGSGKAGAGLRPRTGKFRGDEDGGRSGKQEAGSGKRGARSGKAGAGLGPRTGNFRGDEDSGDRTQDLRPGGTIMSTLCME